MNAYYFTQFFPSFQFWNYVHYWMPRFIFYAAAIPVELEIYMESLTQAKEWRKSHFVSTRSCPFMAYTIICSMHLSALAYLSKVFFLFAWTVQFQLGCHAHTCLVANGRYGHVASARWLFIKMMAVSFKETNTAFCFAHCYFMPIKRLKRYEHDIDFNSHLQYWKRLRGLYRLFCVFKLYVNLSLLQAYIWWRVQSNITRRIYELARLV